METTLLVLAAGIGSRFGGIKQIEPVGLHGEAIIDYSVYDALQAGFSRVVFIIRKSIEDDFKRQIGSRFEDRVEVDYVFQELDALPAGYSVPAKRVKPWGTGHAILLSRELMNGPFAVINADDFYGRESYQLLHGYLSGSSETSQEYAMVGYTLSNTLSDFGSVARGICRVDDAGILQSVTEHTKIEKNAGRIVSRLDDGRSEDLGGDEVVSMNMFGFTPSLFQFLEEKFASFLDENADSVKSEFYIPKAVNALISEGRVSMKVLPSSSQWFGVTYREDLPLVRGSVRTLTEKGIYPEKLW